MASPQVHPQIAELLTTSNGRVALRELVTLAKKANAADRIAGRNGMTMPDVAGEEGAIREEGSALHLEKRGVKSSLVKTTDSGDVKYRASGMASIGAGALGIGMVAGGAFWPVSADGETVPSIADLTPTAGLEIAGGIGLAAVAARSFVKELGFMRSEKSSDGYVKQVDETRDALEAVGFEGAREDHGIDEVFEAVRSDIAGTNSALRAAERSVSKGAEVTL